MSSETDYSGDQGAELAQAQAELKAARAAAEAARSAASDGYGPGHPQYDEDRRLHGTEYAERIRAAGVSAAARDDPVMQAATLAFQQHAAERLAQEGISADEIAKYIETDDGKRLQQLFAEHAKGIKTVFGWAPAFERAIRDLRHEKSRRTNLDLTTDEFKQQAAKRRDEERDREYEEKRRRQQKASEARARLLRGEPDHRPPSILALSPDEWERFKRQVR